MKSSVKYIVIGLSALALASCSSWHKRGSSERSESGVVGARSGELQSHGLGDDGGVYGIDTNGMTTEQLLEVRTYHFAFDSDVVADKDKPAVLAKAHFLASNPSEHVVLAGNTDDRGSREYNIALGWRRAQSVEKMMLLNGASQSQIKLVSYGEEKPVAQGDTESAYAQNRRVDLINEK